MTRGEGKESPEGRDIDRRAFSEARKSRDRLLAWAGGLNVLAGLPVGLCGPLWSVIALHNAPYLGRGNVQGGDPGPSLWLLARVAIGALCMTQALGGLLILARRHRGEPWVRRACALALLSGGVGAILGLLLLGALGYFWLVEGAGFTYAEVGPAPYLFSCGAALAGVLMLAAPIVTFQCWRRLGM